MLIYNGYVIGEGVAVGIPAAILYGLLYYFGVRDADWYAMIAAVALLMPVDFLLRLRQDPGEESQGLLVRLFWPNTGGMLFFVPAWIFAAGILVVLALLP